MGPILLHIDLFRLAGSNARGDRDAICADYEQQLLDMFSNRPILVPTFNYDFCTTGVYDRRESPSQVGALTDYLRRKYPHKRSLTPVFNFCVLQNRDIPLERCDNCFGDQSLFAELVRRDGTVGFLGAAFRSNTFIHHVEEMCDIRYRFLKEFSGVVIDGESQQNVALTYRVRPLNVPIEYDWERLEADLREAGILEVYQTKRTRLLFFKAKSALEFWSEAIQKNERYLLKATNEDCFTSLDLL